MGKKGPCYHCGITSSPLWRNGPPGKPILCNACGSRWRTKGTLANYTPMHAQLLNGPDGLENDLPLFHYTTAWHVQRHFENRHLYDQRNQYHEGDTVSHGSASGSSAHSGSEGDAISGALRTNFWDCPIPSKRRTKDTHQSISPIEIFRRQLVKLHKQEASGLSEYTKDVLIENNHASVYSEIGLGAALLKPLVSSNDVSAPSSCIADNGSPYISMESGKSQNSDFKSIQIDKKCIQVPKDTNEMSGKAPRKLSYTNNSLVSTSISIPDEYGNQYVSEICPPKKGSSVTSCTSHFIGSRWKKSAKKFDDQTHLPVHGGEQQDGESSA